MGAVVELNRSLDQELQALLRSVSLECLVCGEFVLHLPDCSIFCPECGCSVERGAGQNRDAARIRDAGRVTAG